MSQPETPRRGPTGYKNPCRVCGAKPFEQCRSLTKGRKTDTHAPRVRGEWPRGRNEGEDS